MSSNQTVLEVLAREGVLVTEQELIRTTRNKQQLNGVVPVQVKNPAESNGAVASRTPTRYPVPSKGSSDGRQHGRFMNAWRQAWNFLFSALREAYWVLDRDSNVRTQGLQTVGRVTRAEKREHTDSEGDTYYTRHVTYQFEVDGARHTAEKSVGDLRDLKRGVPIKVYFLPDTSPPRSAIDKGAWALSEGQKRVLEASPRLAQTG